MNVASPEQEKKERINKHAVPGQNLDELAAVETGRGSLMSGAEAGLVASSEKQASGKKARRPAKRKNWKKPDVSVAALRRAERSRSRIVPAQCLETYPLFPFSTSQDMPKRPLSSYNLYFKVCVGDDQESCAGSFLRSPIQNGFVTTVKRFLSLCLIGFALSYLSLTFSFYNLFFQHQRELMLGNEAKDYEIIDQSKRKHRKTHGKIGFAEMAKNIGEKWKNLDPSERKVYDDEAHLQKEAYSKAMKEYKARKKAEEKEQAAREEEGMASMKPTQEALLAQQASQPSLLRQPMEATVGLGRPTDLFGFDISLPLSQDTRPDISGRLSGTSSRTDPSTLALSQLQLQIQLRQQQEALQQNLHRSPGQFQTGYSVDATRAALTAAFSHSGQQMGQPLLGLHQLPTGHLPMQQAQNFPPQQQVQARQLHSTEDLLRMQLAMQRQSVGLSGTGLGVLPQGLGASAGGLNTAPSITNVDPRLLEYVVAREQQGTQGGQLPPTGNDAKGSNTFQEGKK